MKTCLFSLLLVFIIFLFLSFEHIVGRWDGYLLLLTLSLDSFLFLLILIVLDFLLALVLFMEYRLRNDSMGEIYFSVAFVIDSLFLIVLTIIMLQSLLQPEGHISHKWDVSIHFFRQLIFAVMSIVAINASGSGKGKYKFVCVLIIVAFIVLGSVFLSAEKYMDDYMSGYSRWHFYTIVVVWFIVLFLAISQGRIKDECRELIVFFALSGGVCNLMLLSVDARNIYPLYLSQTLNVFSNVVVLIILLVQMFNGVTSAKNLLYRDSITSAHNRTEGIIMVKSRLKNMRRGDCCLLVICRVNNLSEINISYGSEFGNYILKGVADVLLSYTDREDIVIRIGGASLLVFMSLRDNIDEAISRYTRLRACVMYYARNLGTHIEIRTKYSTVSVGSFELERAVVDLENLADKEN